jgi:hypothetical protein
MRFHSGNVRAFNNRDSSGRLIPMYNLNTERYQEQLETELEDTLLLSLLYR